MIEKMKKVCVAVQEKDQDHALIQLRDLGVLHIEKTNATSDRLAKALDRKAKAEDAIGLISPYKTPKKKKEQPHDGRERRAPLAIGQRRGRRATDKMGVEELEPYSLDAVNAPMRPDLVDYMMGLNKDLKEFEDRQVTYARERDRIAVWGEFKPESIQELAARGLPVFLYDITPEALATIPPEIRYIKVSEDKAGVRLMALYQEIPGLVPFKLPEMSLSHIEKELAHIQSRLDEMNEKIKSFADRRPTLAKEMAAIQNDIDFEVARTEYKQVEDTPANFGISFLSGYVPSDDMGELKSTAAECGWALTAYDPGEEDMVPTKLKNNKYSEMLSPVTGFLGIVPGYHEIDVSAVFLFFFTIYFGMLFGDAGYGLILLTIAIIAIFKTIKTGVPVALRTLLLLSISNVVWGVLTCSWFGIDLKYVPQELQNLSLSYISPAKTAQAVVDKHLLFFCFSLGLIHLSVAHLMKFFIAIRNGDLKLFSELGSLAMLWGMYNVVLLLMVSGPEMPITLYPLALYLLAGGWVLKFIFGEYQGNIGQSILSSLKNIVTVIFSVVNVFSDIMSYIRLWAVGLAAAAIAATANAMGGPLLGSFLIFAGILILAFGHGLNLILNVLAVLVHGVRLNILEFSSHVGLTWSGIAYKPFAVKR